MGMSMMVFWQAARKNMKECAMGIARDLIAAWVNDYNTEKPHSALGYQTIFRDLTLTVFRGGDLGP